MGWKKKTERIHMLCVSALLMGLISLFVGCSGGSGGGASNVSGPSVVTTCELADVKAGAVVYVSGSRWSYKPFPGATQAQVVSVSVNDDGTAVIVYRAMIMAEATGGASQSGGSNTSNNPNTGNVGGPTFTTTVTCGPRDSNNGNTTATPPPA